jgi:hypothetical protein
MNVTEIITLLTGIMTVVVVPALAMYFKYKLDALKLQNDKATEERAKASANIESLVNDKK